MPRWIPDADFFRNREMDRHEAALHAPTRPALICAKCHEELPSQWIWSTPLADKYVLVEENGTFVRHHRSCGGRVDWVETTLPRKVKRG
jgi:hypothetical protein